MVTRWLAVGLVASLSAIAILGAIVMIAFVIFVFGAMVIAVV